MHTQDAADTTDTWLFFLLFFLVRLVQALYSRCPCSVRAQPCLHPLMRTYTSLRPYLTLASLCTNMHTHKHKNTRTHLSESSHVLVNWPWRPWQLERTIDFYMDFIKRTPGITVSAASQKYCSISSRVIRENSFCSSLLMLKGTSD